MTSTAVYPLLIGTPSESGPAPSRSGSIQELALSSGGFDKVTKNLMAQREYFHSATPYICQAYSVPVRIWPCTCCHNPCMAAVERKANMTSKRDRSRLA